MQGFRVCFSIKMLYIGETHIRDLWFQQRIHFPNGKWWIVGNLAIHLNQCYSSNSLPFMQVSSRVGWALFNHEGNLHEMWGFVGRTHCSSTVVWLGWVLLGKEEGC